MMQNLSEFRVTRPECYVNPKCPGFADPCARQGHYYRVENTETALSYAVEAFPDDRVFDVQMVRTPVGEFLEPRAVRPRRFVVLSYGRFFETPAPTRAVDSPATDPRLYMGEPS